MASVAQSLITNLLKNAEEDIGNKISLILQNISEKVNIESYVQTMMSSKQEVPDVDVSTAVTLSLCDISRLFRVS